MDLTLGAALVGAIQGQLVGFFNKWLDYKYKLKHLKCDTYLKDMDQVRNAKGKQFLITRRWLAFVTSSYMFVLPALMPIIGISVSSSYIDSNGIFSALLHGWESLHWVTQDGFVITATQSYLASLVFNLYFGGKNVW